MLDNKNAPGSTTFRDTWYCKKCDLEYYDERIYVRSKDIHYAESEKISKQLIADAFLAVRQLNPNLKVETEKEKYTQYNEEEEKRLKDASKKDEERERIGKAADKKIRELAGKEVSRSGGVKSVDALQADILKNEDEGLALQKDANKKLDEIAKNTANRGGLT